MSSSLRQCRRCRQPSWCGRGARMVNGSSQTSMPACQAPLSVGQDERSRVALWGVLHLKQPPHPGGCAARVHPTQMSWQLSKHNSCLPTNQLSSPASRAGWFDHKGWAPWEQKLLLHHIFHLLLLHPAQCFVERPFKPLHSTFKVSICMAHCIKGTSRRQADVQHCSYCFDVLIAQLTGLQGPPPDFEDGNWYVTTRNQRWTHADPHQLPAHTALGNVERVQHHQPVAAACTIAARCL